MASATDFTQNNNLWLLADETINGTVTNDGDTCAEYDSLCDRSDKSPDLIAHNGLILNTNNYGLDGINDYGDTQYTLPDIKSVGVWVRTNVVYPSAIQVIMRGSESGSSVGEIAHRGDLVNKPIEVYCGDGSNYYFEQYANPFSNTVDYEFFNVNCLTSDLELYVNGVLQTPITSGGTATGSLVFSTADCNVVLGRRCVAGDRPFGGSVQGVSFDNVTRSSPVVDELYLLGPDYNPYLITPDNFTITLENYYTGNSLTNFTAYFDSTIYNDGGTGTIITNVLNTNGSLFNLTIEKENFFNSTYADIDVLTNLQAAINETNITLRIVFNNTNVTANFSIVDLNDLTYLVNFTSTTGYFNINPPPLENIIYNVFCNRTIFESVNVTLNFSNKDTNEYIIYVEPTFNSITFYDVENASPIGNALVNITYPVSGDTIQVTTNSTGSALFSYINDDIAEFGNYTFKFNKLGYNLITITKDINASNVPAQLNYNISRSNLIINIFNRETSQLLTATNVSLNLLGVFQNTTSNGTYVYENIALISQEYTLQAISTGYVTEQTTFIYDNQGNLTINVYLLNSTGVNTGLLFASVIDQYYFRQINADTILMEYSSTEKGFIKVSECLTNTNGECVFNIELNVKTYIISASKTIDGELFTATTGTAGEIIRTDQESRRLILRTDEEFEATDIDNLLIAVSESFINNISSIDVAFKNINNVVTTVCVEYFIVNGFSQESIQQDCTSSSEGIANLGVSYSLNRSNTYKAEIYNLVSSVKLPLKSYNYLSLTSLASTLNKYGMARYLILGLFVAVLGVCLYLTNMSAFFIVILFMSWPLYGLFSDILLVKFIVAIDIICVFGIYLARKKRQDG